MIYKMQDFKPLLHPIQHWTLFDFLNLRPLSCYHWQFTFEHISVVFYVQLFYFLFHSKIIIQSWVEKTKLKSNKTIENWTVYGPYAEFDIFRWSTRMNLAMSRFEKGT